MKDLADALRDLAAEVGLSHSGGVRDAAAAAADLRWGEFHAALLAVAHAASHVRLIDPRPVTTPNNFSRDAMTAAFAAVEDRPFGVGADPLTPGVGEENFVRLVRAIVATAGA